MKSTSYKGIDLSKWLLGLLFPIASFVYALIRPQDRNYKVLCVLFFTFVGLGFVYTDGTDVYQYLDYFATACGQKGFGFFQYFQTINEAQQIDYYNAFITWLVSRFTSDGKIFLGVLAFVNAYFLTENVLFVIKRNEINNFTRLFLAVLILVPPFGFITHRWWTALQVFLFGLLPAVFDNKKIRLVWCAFAAFAIHFSFLYPLIVVVISFFLPAKIIWPYLILYLVSFLINQFDFSSFSPYLNILFSDMVATRTEGYINYELQEHNLFSQSARIAINISNVIVAIFISLKGKEVLDNNKELKRFFLMSLIFGAFSQLAGITEWGWRFYDLSNMMFVVVYVFYISQKGANNNVFKYVVPLLIYFMLFQIRGFFSVMGPNQFFLGNYFTTWFLHDTDSLLEIIKSVL